MNRNNSSCPVYGEVLWHLDPICGTAVIGAMVAALNPVITLPIGRRFSGNIFWQLGHLGSALVKTAGVTGSNSCEHQQG